MAWATTRLANKPFPARLLPIAGQLAAVGIGYWSINTVTMRHIARCEKLVAELESRKETP